jgi:DNA-binding HxlR family transcriptional regulator
MQPHKPVIALHPGGHIDRDFEEPPMVKRTSLEGDACPIARALDAIGDWWSLLIIRDALLGRRRFGEFQRSLGLAKNILSARLRNLVERGILATEPASDGSVYRDYVPTAKGRGLFPILVALRQWSEEFDERPQEIATILVDRSNGRPVRKLVLYAEDGRVLAPADTTLKPRPGSVPSGGDAGALAETASN